MSLSCLESGVRQLPRGQARDRSALRAERDELVVYTDGASWTQELSMMREIIRARMERLGGAVGNIVVKTSRPGFERA